ncbi:hypothetical protein C0993_010580 [Termitomyces sp. T159_Od127]|nr:hypothetical protein C0993_010580 [Termitomyces sp. T159_Od127]
MFALRTFSALATAAVVVANILRMQQDNNTNPYINHIVSTLDGVVHVVMPNIRSPTMLLQANQTDDDSTIGAQINYLITAFNTARSALAATPVSNGSTVIFPTNDHISIVFADVMSYALNVSSFMRKKCMNDCIGF